LQNGNDFGEEYKDFVLIERPLLCIKVNASKVQNDDCDDIRTLLEFEPSLDEIRNKIQDWCRRVIEVNQDIGRLEALLFPGTYLLVT
jgi:hypothetical protein